MDTSLLEFTDSFVPAAAVLSSRLGCKKYKKNVPSIELLERRIVVAEP